MYNVITLMCFVVQYLYIKTSEVNKLQSIHLENILT